MFDEKSLSNWDAILFLLRHQMYKPGAFVKLRRWQRLCGVVWNTPSEQNMAAQTYTHTPQCPTSRTPKTGFIQLILLFLLSSFPRVECDIGPLTNTHTRVVSKVFPTDFASRKVRTVETVWNEANSDTERTQSSSSHVVVSVSARWLLRPRRRQRTKKQGTFASNVKAH